jgi:hypothetical protein
MYDDNNTRLATVLYSFVYARQPHYGRVRLLPSRRVSIDMRTMFRADFGTYAHGSDGFAKRRCGFESFNITMNVRRRKGTQTAELRSIAF